MYRQDQVCISGHLQNLAKLSYKVTCAQFLMETVAKPSNI